MGLFVDKKAEFPVTIAIAKVKGNPDEVLCDISRKDLLEVYGDDVDPATIEEHTIWCGYPDFGTIVSISGDTTRTNEMIALIRRWTLKGDVDPEAIKALNPHIAYIIGIKIEMELQPEHPG